ncbi:hypothetical protein Indivirus_4_15 [Indivirus ILV1]|uniref:Uncharacterized protein n=1 Tax=Indivirus ILV1 TaxID=1977633 RepID=A0A1V0SDP6_9VIRU|nr:hypothetical protein Indivirus_4_15 [Indivirus ILV1]
MKPLERKIETARAKRKTSKKQVQSEETKKKAAEKNKIIRQRLKENPNLEKCIGILKNGERCNKYPDEGEMYCEVHKYFEDLTEEQIDKIKNKEAFACYRCPKWYFNNNRTICSECVIYNANKQKERQNSQIKCEWTTRKDKNCISFPFENSKYCGDHSYVNNYTNVMKEKSRLCRGCKMVVYIEDGYDTCKKDRDRGKINREKKKEKTQDDPKCPAIIDDHICGNIIFAHGYCGKHQLNAWKKIVEKDGTKKVCIDHIRGCRELLDINSDKSKCLDCIYQNAYNEAKCGATKGKRNYSFEITDEFYYGLINKPCYYCGEFDEKGWNGADRKDNNIGYIKQNCVSCCSMCNIMKSDYTISQLLQYCQNIYDNYPSTNYFDKGIEINHMSYTEYCGLANRRKIKFNLTSDEFDEILLKRCFYCNNTNIINQIGLDRILSKYYYSYFNCVACCMVCNRMKNKYALTNFINKIKLIVNNGKLKILDNIKISL